MKYLRLLNLGLGVLFGYGAFLCFLFISLSHFDPTYSLGNLIQAGSTVAVAVVVAAYIQRQTQVDFKHKELLIKQLDMVSEKLVDLSDFNFEEGDELVKITSVLKQTSMRCNAVYTAVKLLQYADNIVAKLDFNSDISELRKLATETPISTLQAHLDECPAVVRDGIIELAAERLCALQVHLTTMQNRVFEAQIAIMKN
jgi:uncharacterized protein HemX